MVITKRRRRGSWLLFGIRALGVTGLFAFLLGALGARRTPGHSLRGTLTDFATNPQAIPTALFNTTDRFYTVCLWLIVLGAVCAILAGLALFIGGLGRLAGRRNVAGTNAVLQTALAVVLLVGVNAWSFHHYKRFDWTGRKLTWDWPYPRLAASERFEPQFTLPDAVVADLKQLRGETKVVVYQRHKTPGQFADKPDAYDYAAERKIVEKVRDLVGLFREFGPQFSVQVLDVEDEGFTRAMKDIERNNPQLAKAIDAAPVNSIFFQSTRAVPGPDGKPVNRESIQRLSFSDFYQLDKSASKAADGGRGNLVLLPQGIGSFARRVLAIEEKKPKIALGTIHEYLTSQGQEELTLAGLRKSLEQNGFEVVDIVLKKGWNEGEPVAGAVTLNETQYERLEEELADYDAVLQINKQELKFMSGLVEKLKSNMTLDELNRELKPILRGQRLDETARKRNIANLEPQLEMLREYMSLQEKERNETLKQLEAIPGQERLAEQRRQTDTAAKFRKLLADCDMVILPRMTVRNAVTGEVIPAWLHRLDDGQTLALRDFMAAGKPVFGLFGPVNEPTSERRRPGPRGPDGIEVLFNQLGVVFGGQTILFNSELKAFSQRRVSLLATGAEVEVPPALFERPKGRADVEADDPTGQKPNAIARSLKVVAAAAGSADKLEKLKLRHPRPVYFVPVRGPGDSAAEFLFADADSWNEADPFPNRDKTPRYEPTKPDSPLYGTRDAETRGPFPIGVAVETTVPAAWRDDPQPQAAAAALLAGSATGAAVAIAAQSLIPADDYARGPIPRLRVAAVGHGGLFTGPELSPAKEQFLLTACNWLLARDERLARDDHPAWHYPRVSLSGRRLGLWRDGAVIALPAAVAFLGSLVLLVRKYR
ncbi:MAG: hypothetical protein K1X57_02200 [Gemmataceae bacterium]|nr:hypothetical protein [Gemmataceae bacterium]